MTNSNNTNTSNFFDFVANGYGYLNKVAIITPDKGPKYLIANLCLLSGAVNNPSKTYVYCTVKGAEAHALLMDNLDKLQNAINSKVPVAIRVEIGDLTTGSYKNGKGEFVPKLDARVLRISHLRIGKKGEGEVLFSSSSTTNENPSEGQDQNSEAPESVNSAEAKPESQVPVESEANVPAESEGPTEAEIQAQKDLEEKRKKAQEALAAAQAAMKALEA